MIKGGLISSKKEKGKHPIKVDKNLLKFINRAQQALQEAKVILLNIETASEQMKQAKKVIKEEPAKKSVRTATKPLKKSLKKSIQPIKKIKKSSKLKQSINK